METLFLTAINSDKITCYLMPLPALDFDLSRNFFIGLFLSLKISPKILEVTFLRNESILASGTFQIARIVISIFFPKENEGS